MAAAPSRYAPCRSAWILDESPGFFRAGRIDPHLVRLLSLMWLKNKLEIDLPSERQIADYPFAMKKEAVLAKIRTEKVIAIIRADSPNGLLDCAKALAAGGLTSIELTMTTPGAIAMLQQASTELPDFLFGLGPRSSRSAGVTAFRSSPARSPPPRSSPPGRRGRTP